MNQFLLQRHCRTIDSESDVAQWRDSAEVISNYRLVTGSVKLSFVIFAPLVLYKIEDALQLTGTGRDEMWIVCVKHHCKTTVTAEVQGWAEACVLLTKPEYWE